MGDIVKIGWSGGKDSTCAVMKHIERGDQVKAVCYIPMFTKDVPLILKSHYQFIKETARYFQSLGAKVYFALGGLTYYEYVTHIAKKGKYKGRMFGFPCVGRGMCGFKRDGKIRALKKCDVGPYDYEGVGIAYDETSRHSQLNENFRSILYELKITEDEARRFDEVHGILSPHYSYNFGKKNNRDGCSICPNATYKEFEAWVRDYPQAVPIILELQRIVRKYRPENRPLRGHRWFIDGRKDKRIIEEAEWALYISCVRKYSSTYAEEGMRNGRKSNKKEKPFGNRA